MLRINSPGGSAVASDMIAREVQLLKDAGKPVVACMGDVAASGGYYIAGADSCVLTALQGLSLVGCVFSPCGVPLDSGSRQAHWSHLLGCKVKDVCRISGRLFADHSVLFTACISCIMLT